MKKILKFLLFAIVVIILVIAYSRYVGTSGLVTKEYKIETNKIDDSFDGLKIVHFSDLHYKRIINRERLESVVEEINLINPDIVFFTGDLIDKDFDITDQDKIDLTECLKMINSKYGKYAVNGNHDYVRDENLLNEIYDGSDFILLNNNYDIIYGDGDDKLFIGGLDNYSYGKSDIDKVMNYFVNNEDISYKIILVHEPDYADNFINRYNIDLILSGHSHNGQVNIPYIKKLFLPYGS